MELIKHYVDYVIVSILLLMGFIALMYTIERVLYFRKLDINAFKSRDELETALSTNLTTLYIIYSNAPYVGLLGTVIGIMITFYDMSLSDNLDTKSIMQGLSLALYATALGLIVAIPTLIAYNALKRKIVVLETQYKEASHG